MNKINRNSPCPCGSGKKYKKCCWGKDQKTKKKSSEQSLFGRIKSASQDRISVAKRMLKNVKLVPSSSNETKEVSSTPSLGNVFKNNVEDTAQEKSEKEEK